MDSITVEACPACESSAREETGRPAPPIAAPAGEETFIQPAYRILECGRCGLLYRDRTLSPEAFRRYYSLVPALKWEAPRYHPTERAVLAALTKLRPGSTILDFGCSSGRLLAGVVSTHACYGIEINHAAAATAEEKGLRILSLDDLATKDAPRFDAIVLVDVFEHLAQPLRVLSQLRGTLAPGGRLILVTGNGDAPACRRDPGQFWYFREIEHVCMLTRKSADFLAGDLSLRLTTWQALHHYDLSLSEKLVQKAQDFAYWQFRRTTFVARVLEPLPIFDRLKRADVAPTYNCARDHVLAIFSENGAGCRA